MALNNVSIMGRITHDIELKSTQSGVAVTQFAIAVERDFKDASGAKVTDFIDVVAFRNTAEFLGKYFGKGRMIAVSGKLQTRMWQDKNGNNRKAVEIVADSVYFADSKPKENANASGSFDTSGYEPLEFGEVDVDGELPF